MQQPPEFITVTIDKSHITTIGERLYAESIEFVRELVNNAYDADAEFVEIMMIDDAIEIRDNGSGMDIAEVRYPLVPRLCASYKQGIQCSLQID